MMDDKLRKQILRPCVHHSSVTVHRFPLQLVLELCLRVLLVSLDDHLYKVMPHNVFLCEIDKLNAAHAGHYALSLDKSRTATGRQVDLSYVAGDHGLRSESYPGEKHLHL